MVWAARSRFQLDHVKQAGATGVVSALHHLYRGEAWSLDEVLKRKTQIEAAGLDWSVVESIPVHNSIKLQTGPFRQFTDAWKDSLAGDRTGARQHRVLQLYARSGLDPHGFAMATAQHGMRSALRCDRFLQRMTYFFSERTAAEQDYSAESIAAARARYDSKSDARRNEQERTIIAGLPGAEASYTRTTLKNLLAEYAGLTAAELRAHLIPFLREVAPVAEELGARLAIHPDDPPWPLFGLPRVVSTAEDVRAILAGVADTAANGG